MPRCQTQPGVKTYQNKLIVITATVILMTSQWAHSEGVLQFLPAILASPSCHLDYTDIDPKYDIQYRGLHYYCPDMSHRDYGLEQLTDAKFNNLSLEDRRKVADKLLGSLFFGYPEATLKQKITSRKFLCSVRKGLMKQSNNMSEIEAEIRDDERYYHYYYAPNEVHDILARFYAMEDLDQHYLHNWIAYILTQTILFSPAYELDSTHYPNVASVYNWLVLDMFDDLGFRYSTFLHMESYDNWRRFRSPEDNGREMLEIYAFDFEDAQVPKAAKTLQNWYLDEEGDTLVVGLNQNTIPQSLFGTTVTTGSDFYRELVKSDVFLQGVIRRIVDFFFTEHTTAEKVQLTAIIAGSQPKTWQDILVQIVFSKEYLLHTSRVKSAEELFYSLVKKLDYKHYRSTFRYFNYALSDMNQASMKYKLGKLERVPLDTISFAEYHKYIRESILIRNVCGLHEETTYNDWNTYGWRPSLITENHFNYIEDNPEVTLTSFISYLFNFILHRDPNHGELEMFKTNMLTDDRENYQWNYNVSRTNDEGCYSWRENIAEDVLDYLSRLTEFYRFQEVQP